MAEMGLPALESWMQAVIVHPSGIDQALGAAGIRRQLPPQRLAEVIRPSRSLTAAARLAVYQGMYLLRMEEALASDYPGLQRFLGERRFFELVREYVGSFPSRHYSLNRLGDHLPQHLAGARWPRAGFCHDLARLELAVSEVFDAEETAALSEATVAAIPAGAWEQACLRPVAAFRCLALRYPVVDYLDALKAGRPLPPGARRRSSWVVVFRRSYSIRRQSLSRAAFHLLADLAAGVPVGAAVQRALRRPGPRPTEDHLFRWFRGWLAEGIFHDVRLVLPAEPTTQGRAGTEVTRVREPGRRWASGPGRTRTFD